MKYFLLAVCLGLNLGLSAVQAAACHPLEHLPTNSKPHLAQDDPFAEELTKTKSMTRLTWILYGSALVAYFISVVVGLPALIFLAILAVAAAPILGLITFIKALKLRKKYEALGADTYKRCKRYTILSLLAWLPPMLIIGIGIILYITSFGL